MIPRSAVVAGFFLVALVLLYSILSIRNDLPASIRFIHRKPETKQAAGFYDWNTTSHFYPVKIDVADPTTEQLCATFPKHLLESVQTVLKLGHSEPKERIDSVLDISSCLDNLLIFSDAKEVIHGRQIIDILADLPSSYYEHEDFQEYFRQRAALAKGESRKNKDWSKKGWNLDRHKFLPMIERTWQMRPDRKWYVFFESDTYIVWDNLFRLLEHYNPDRPLYFGSPTPGRDGINFAYGGTGYVISRAAMKRLVQRKTSNDGSFSEEGLTARWKDQVFMDPCGDAILGYALHDNASVVLDGLWPMFSPLPEQSIPYSERYWCQPVISGHKLSPERSRKLWKWEHTRRNPSKPMTFQDMFEFTRPEFREHPIREDWDNADWDGFRPEPESTAHSSFQACGQACKDHPECFQYNHRLNTCTFVRSIRMGNPKEPDKGQPDENGDFPSGSPRFMAGFHYDKIERWAREHTCEKVLWVKPSLKRIF